VLLRLAYLVIVNLFSALRLLSVSERDENTEILVLGHQVTLLQRQLGDQRVMMTPSDRFILGASLSPLPRAALRRLHLIVRPDTVLRWHRDLLKRRHARAARRARPGRPRTVRSIRTLVLRLFRENPQWDTAESMELATLGIKVAASTVWEILKTEGIDPPRNAPRRPGLPSSTLRRTRCWPATSSRPSP
jgi:putative transposase